MVSCFNNKAHLIFKISVIKTIFTGKNHENKKNELSNIDANGNVEFRVVEN